MKKHLLGTTAVIGAGLMVALAPSHAQTVKMGVSGYMEQIFGVTFDRAKSVPGGLNDTTGTGAGTAVSFDQQTESEIFFRGSGKLDNGIEIVAQVELEVAGSPGALIDEQFVIIRGSFGQVELGSTDNAAYKTTIGYSGSWATGVGQNSTFDSTDWIAPAIGLLALGDRFDGSLNDIRLRSTDDDSSKISYFTPRVEGFQLGVSYIPNFTQSTAPAGEAVATKATYHEGWAIGGNYDRKIGDFGVGLAAGYLTAKSPGRNSVQTATAFKNTDDMGAYSVAARIDYGPFRLSGAYKENNDVRAASGASTTTSLDANIYDVGARYTFGANAVSVSWRSGEAEASLTPGEDKEDAFLLSFARTVGPGVVAHANLWYANYENEVSGPGSENDGWALTTAVRLSF